MANEAVDEKTNEVTEIRMQVEEMCMAVMQKDQTINDLQAQVKQMQDNIRSMTSFSGQEADETFEKVLRDEYTAMKKSYAA